MERGTSRRSTSGKSPRAPYSPYAEPDLIYQNPIWKHDIPVQIEHASSGIIYFVSEIGGLSAFWESTGQPLSNFPWPCSDDIVKASLEPGPKNLPQVSSIAVTKHYLYITATTETELGLVKSMIQATHEGITLTSFSPKLPPDVFATHILVSESELDIHITSTSGYGLCKFHHHPSMIPFLELEKKQEKEKQVQDQEQAKKVQQASGKHNFRLPPPRPRPPLSTSAIISSPSSSKRRIKGGKQVASKRFRSVTGNKGNKGHKGNKGNKGHKGHKGHKSNKGRKTHKVYKARLIRGAGKKAVDRFDDENIEMENLTEDQSGSDEGERETKEEIDERKDKKEEDKKEQDLVDADSDEDEEWLSDVDLTDDSDDDLDHASDSDADNSDDGAHSQAVKTRIAQHHQARKQQLQLQHQVSLIAANKSATQLTAVAAVLAENEIEGESNSLRSAPNAFPVIADVSPAQIVTKSADKSATVSLPSASKRYLHQKQEIQRVLKERQAREEEEERVTREAQEAADAERKKKEEKDFEYEDESPPPSPPLAVHGEVLAGILALEPILPSPPAFLSHSLVFNNSAEGHQFAVFSAFSSSSSSPPSSSSSLDIEPMYLLPNDDNDNQSLEDIDEAYVQAYESNKEVFGAETAQHAYDIDQLYVQQREREKKLAEKLEKDMKEARQRSNGTKLSINGATTFETRKRKRILGQSTHEEEGSSSSASTSTSASTSPPPPPLNTLLSKHNQNELETSTALSLASLRSPDSNNPNPNPNAKRARSIADTHFISPSLSISPTLTRSSFNPNTLLPAEASKMLKSELEPRILWMKPPPPGASAYCWQMQIYQGVLFAQSSLTQITNGTTVETRGVEVFTLQTGQPITRFELPPGRGPPAEFDIGDNFLWVGTTEGKIYQYHLADPPNYEASKTPLRIIQLPPGIESFSTLRYYYGILVIQASSQVLLYDTVHSKFLVTFFVTDQSDTTSELHDPTLHLDHDYGWMYVASSNGTVRRFPLPVFTGRFQPLSLKDAAARTIISKSIPFDFPGKVPQDVIDHVYLMQPGQPQAYPPYRPDMEIRSKLKFKPWNHHHM